jgi:hypothetical protein
MAGKEIYQHDLGSQPYSSKTNQRAGPNPIAAKPISGKEKVCHAVKEPIRSLTLLMQFIAVGWNKKTSRLFVLDKKLD